MSAIASSARSDTNAALHWVVLGLGLSVLLLVFLPEGLAAVRVWYDSTAYGHCFLVVPIAAYLAWDRRDEVRGLRPHAEPWLLLLGLPFPLAWFAAERLGIMEGRQLVALAFVELLFLCVLGRALFRAMLGPLLYLVFLVPFGAFVTPVLQTVTAHFIDVGLTVLGIAHFSNDMFIEISAGTFYVAEACAGLRFLIASIAFGVFYALLNYRSPGRRAVFITASIVVPVVANGLRALGIVVLGQVLGSAEAAAADHIIYGWVFFSAVMLLLVVAGLPLRESPMAIAALPRQQVPKLLPSSWPRPRLHPWAALLVPALAAAGPSAALALSRGMQPVTVSGQLDFVAPEGCQVVAAPLLPGIATAILECGARKWHMTLQALPRRSTAAAISEARASLVYGLGSEEATTQSLSSIPAVAGAWTAVIDHSRITAYSVWVHGAPARGGLSQRIDQAWDSILGTEVPPTLLGASLLPPGVLGEAPTTAALAELTRILAAQTGWPGTIMRLTGSSSPPPPP